MSKIGARWPRRNHLRLSLRFPAYGHRAGFRRLPAHAHGCRGGTHGVSGRGRDGLVMALLTGPLAQSAPEWLVATAVESDLNREPRPYVTTVWS